MGNKNNSGVQYRSASKAGKKNVAKGKVVMGFDMGDPESKVAFFAFIIVSVFLAALLIAGFGLGIARCVGGEQEALPEVSPTSVEVSGADSAVASSADVVVSGGEAFEVE